MAVVVSDAGPLIALAKVDALFVARRLFSRLQIPEAVWSECRGKPGEDSRRIAQAGRDGWLRVVKLTTEATRKRFPHSLGRGEIEALQLAMETKPSLLIVDDRLARRQALQLELNFIGTARMLLLAEQRSLIDDAETVVQQMTANGYRISPRVLQQLKARDIPVAQKIGAVEAASEFIERRAAGARPDELTRYLDDAPDTPPAPGDELPEA